MTKEGYVVARNRKTEQYFTSTSSYDRPRWTAVKEATVYMSAELAQKAAVKLGINGAYGACIIPLKEAMSFQMPDEQLPPSDMQPQNPDGMEMDIGPDGNGGTEMTAADQEEPCEQCQHSPCTCDHGDDVDDDIAAHFDDMGDKISDPSDPGMVGDEQDGESVDDLVDDELKNQPRSPRMESIDTTVHKITYANAAQTDAEDTTAHAPDAELDAKVKVPSEVISDLKAAIAKFDKDGKEYDKRDDARASFSMTIAGAFEELLDLLQQGTVEGVKMAQVKMTSWMNPITSNLPVSVQKFIFTGGKKATLKDLFDTKKSEKKALTSQD